ncbi:DUF4303 domain-containing protein [Morganella morganii]|uniref:DUF4303 domain-containing protein n=1 Tax=Morganella morganii TaxID=582 RepID=UPI000F4A2D11|nr:DUF4303 domain-containing protein [Morganella morganii]ROJ30453.1 hypothetical protein BFD15_18005 [Morganella morganii]
MDFISEYELSDEIEKAAGLAFFDLFKKQEFFYYCSLITTGNALPPVIVAWSYEALERYMKNNHFDDSEKEFIKWSYADSPYLNYGEKYMAPLAELFNHRPMMDVNMSNEEWKKEFDLRLGAMETAMSNLDSIGVFGEGERRKKIVINVEVMPPDFENTLRAMRLNPKESLCEWLSEIAEPIP